MPDKESLITKLEKGRAEFAYRCVKEVIELKPTNQNSYASIAIRKFKENVRESLEKEIKEGKINEQRINELLENPTQFLDKGKLSDEEKRVLSFYETLCKNYRAYARKIPQMILSNGLGQTLAFVKSKAKNGNAYEVLYSQMTDYLKSDSTARIPRPQDINELVEWVISLNSYQYRYAIEEILAFLNWVKRFAEGLIETEEEGEG